MPVNRSELKASPSPETLRMVEKLKEMHADGAGAATGMIGTSLLGGMPSPTDVPLAGYADLQTRLAGLETQLRTHANRVDKVVETVAPPAATAAITQTTLFLQGPWDGQTGGKFICRNKTDQVAEIEMEIGRFKDSRDHVIDGVALVVDGLEPALEPFEQRCLSCRINLRASSPSPRGQLEGWVVFRLSGASALRLWIEVDLHE